MKEQPSPTVVLNRLELHANDTAQDLTPVRGHHHQVINTNIESPNQSGLEFEYSQNQQQNTPTNSGKFNRTSEALNLTDNNVAGSGGRLSALRNWLKQTRWRRKDKSTPPGTPKHFGKSESPSQMRNGLIQASSAANSPHGELTDSGSKSKAKSGKNKKQANEFMTYKEKVMRKFDWQF